MEFLLDFINGISFLSMKSSMELKDQFCNDFIAVILSMVAMNKQ